MAETESVLRAAMDAYLAAGRPPICPRCGAWDGPTLPTCIHPDWTHTTACEQIRYADGSGLARPTTDHSSASAAGTSIHFTDA